MSVKWRTLFLYSNIPYIVVPIFLSKVNTSAKILYPTHAPEYSTFEFECQSLLLTKLYTRFGMSKWAPILWGVHSLVNVGVLRLRNILQVCYSLLLLMDTPIGCANSSYYY